MISRRAGARTTGSRSAPGCERLAVGLRAVACFEFLPVDVGAVRVVGAHHGFLFTGVLDLFDALREAGVGQLVADSQQIQIRPAFLLSPTVPQFITLRRRAGWRSWGVFGEAHDDRVIPCAVRRHLLVEH